MKQSYFPEPLPGISRIKEINILGVTYSSCLGISQHIANQISKCSSLLYALKILKSKSLSHTDVQQVFNALVIARLLYSCQAWWGFASMDDISRLKGFIKRSKKYGYCNDNFDLDDQRKKLDAKLFRNIARNEHHVLHQFLPPPTNHKYNLRERNHDFMTPVLTSLSCKNFLNRMMFSNYALHMF